jgi:hypothetical protein
MRGSCKIQAAKPSGEVLTKNLYNLLHPQIREVIIINGIKKAPTEAGA